ncbi:MAG: hypothetical protein E7554_10710 [Ruminococcaceae bacterium]|nr:hypothetical protein [Oscillospiraceae bacterium]
MNNNTNNEQELRLEGAPVCPEEEEHVCAPEQDAQTADSAEASYAEGLTVAQALSNIGAEVEALERAARIFSGGSAENNAAASPDAKAEAPDCPEVKTSEPDCPEDDYSSIERVFASRPPRENPEPERLVFNSSQDNAAVTVSGDEDLLRWLVNGISDGSVTVDGSEPEAEPEPESAEGGRGKVFSTFLCLLASLLVLGGVAYYILCAHGLRAIVSIDEVEVNANVYSMTYSGSYGLDDLIEQGGVSTDGELMEFLSGQYFFGLMDMPDVVSGPSGSSDGVLSVLNSDCENSRALTGRSHSCQSQTMTMIVSTRRSDGRETVTTVDIGRLGYTPYDRPGLFNGYAALASVYLPLDGMNDHGLCVTAVELPGDPRPVTDTVRPDLTVTAAVRMLLDSTTTVEEAVEMLGRFDIYPSFGCDYHLLISDREGSTAAIEWYDGQMYRVNIPYISNERVYSPDGLTGAAGFDTETGRIMTLLAGSYSQYDGHMTTEQILGVIGRAATRAGGWGVVYDSYTDTAYFRFEGETEKQVTVSMSPA